MHDFKWTASEKKLAREVFERALATELAETIAEFKRLASAVVEADDMWRLEEFLRKRRGEIDRKYDYRYSQLAHVLGILLREGKLKESDLGGLSRDKMDQVVRVAFAEVQRGRAFE